MIILKDCSTETLSDGVVVTPNSQVYEGKAQFSCRFGGTLLNKNGTERLDNNTQCLADATWRDQNDVQCANGEFVSSLSASYTVCAMFECSS